MSLELRDISFSSEKETYIYPTNLLLKGGSLNILLGPTLSGKTSLMRLMVGLDPPDNGNIFWNGENVTRKSVRKRNVAMVYQQFINYPSLSVYENIASPLRLLKTPTSEIDQKVKSVAELMKLSKLLDRKPLKLSGGQQQRVALARALVKEADLVLLDEPLANLDYKLREELRSEIPQIFSETGSVFVYATTEASDALLLGGNTACLHEGKIVQYDETLKLYHHPVNLAAARVFSDPPLNILPVIRTDEALQIGDNLSVSLNDYVRKISNGRYFLAFRPIKLSPYKNPEKKDIIEFKGVVDVAEITGSETIIHLKFGQESLVSMVHGVYKTQINQALSFYLDLKNAYIFDPEEKLVLSPEILQEREHGYNPS